MKDSIKKSLTHFKNRETSEAFKIQIKGGNGASVDPTGLDLYINLDNVGPSFDPHGIT